MNLIFGNRKILERRAAKTITKKIQELLKKQKFVILGTVGGRSAPKVFENLRNQKIPWNKVHLFLVDEIISHSKNKQSNINTIDSISSLIPKRNIHPYNPEKPVSNYYRELKKYGGNFDIVLLSSGEDGHVGSLFPNLSAIKNTKPGYLEVSNSPKPPKSRITASSSLIRKSKLSILLFLGKNKEEAYKKFINKEIKITECPAKLVNTIKESYVLTDLQG